MECGQANAFVIFTKSAHKIAALQHNIVRNNFLSVVDRRAVLGVSDNLHV
jgi:hypothetical protein